MADLKEMLTYYKEGTTVELTVQSLDGGEYKERTVSVTLGKRETAETN
jgi:serine protease Do